MLTPQISQHENPMANEEVFKVGRTTGLTSGFVNPVSSTSLIAACIVKGETTILYDTVEAQLVVSKLGSDGMEQAPPKPFSSYGDSGSAIFGRNGCFKGLLFAGSETHDRNYFTPVEALFEDIKAITGAVTVTLL